ncbi:phosphotransferase [Neorhizobium sp. CSC1952]|uniref:phosphotransferase enzyme family protein n=1 Tax=Neorhizobium sp. CSC1952 TaxID=2978974 RepID=UPI0025A56ABE|nr:phosphotransferase [Rhizobium sp. CSC1952]WJR65375.1 phosphotransferase [Rhizobium sp. CSC1952]
MFDLRPLYSTLHIEAITQFIGEHYAVEGPVSCQMLQRGLNDVYLVTGKNGERYVFRLSQHRARGPADVKTETAFLIHLSQSGVPVAAPVPTREGTFFVQAHAPEGWRSGVLFQALEGREPHATDLGDAWANGKTLAMLHNASEAFSSDGAVYRLDLEHLLWRPLARLQESGIIEDVSAYNDLKRIAEEAGRAIEAFGNLTWAYCHGDCHGFNSRINDVGEAVFFDFDDSGPGYLAYDLSVFLWANVSFGRKTIRRWDAFIEGYRAVRPIGSDDFEAAICFVIVRHFWLMGEYATRANEWGSNTVSWIAREANFLKTWQTEQLVNRLF